MCTMFHISCLFKVGINNLLCGVLKFSFISRVFGASIGDDNSLEARDMLSLLLRRNILIKTRRRSMMAKMWILHRTAIETRKV